ncbi:MAG TPA: preprotein translocase subunit SecY [Dehalococcoidia bacterium]|nr:preprotein translocase subunit SecY [Dehalococcoidia bacterium]
MQAGARPQARQGSPRLLQAVVDAFQQADVRAKLLFTLAMLVIFRFVAHVPVPNVDSDVLDQVFDDNAALGFLDIFSGGALRNLSIAALGVYPYISASIILQLLTPVVPRLQALSQEGEQGRNRIQLYTYWLTVPLAMVQGYAQLIILERNGAIANIGFTEGDALPTLATILAMTGGTMFLVWLGELITERGIGNGLSIIIFGGIVAGFPGLIGNVLDSNVSFGGVAILAVLAVVMIAAIVYVQEAQRRIPVQYARSMFRSGRMYRQSGQSHIPLRVNSAGMIPLIFAYSIMIFPTTAAQFFEASDTGWVRDTADFIGNVFDPTNPVYWTLVFLMVVAFTFFYTMVVFQQQNLAENLQKQSGFIPGIRPGRPTQEYITRVLTRITWGGALFLGLMAIIPYAATRFMDVNALTISSTGLLIVVGVVLDTMRQLEAQLLMRNYEGFIR